LGSVVGFDPKNIVEVHAEDDYPEALKKGEIKAAFLEVPYVKMYLAKYCEGFTTSGPTLKVGGFGFVSVQCAIHRFELILHLPFLIKLCFWIYIFVWA